MVYKEYDMSKDINEFSYQMFVVTIKNYTLLIRKIPKKIEHC